MATASHTVPTIRKPQNDNYIKFYWSLIILGTVRAKLGDTEPTSLVVMWELLSSTELVATYTISFHNTNSTQCFNDSDIITGITAMQYAPRNLQEASEYSIAISTMLNDGMERVSLAATTLAAGQHL